MENRAEGAFVDAKPSLHYNTSEKSGVGRVALKIWESGLQVESTASQTAAVRSDIRQQMRAAPNWFRGRQGRRIREMLLAYSFLAPAYIIIGLFGLFPLAFAAYESTLRGLNKIVGTYDGLGNYVKAIDNLIYILAFWLAAGLVYFAVHTIARAVQDQREHQTESMRWLVPGLLTAIGTALFTRFVYILLPEMLLIPSKLRGRANTQEAFRGLVVETWWLPKMQIALWVAVVILAGGGIWALLVNRQMPTDRRERIYFMPFFSAGISLIGGAALAWLTWTEINSAYAEALEEGVGLELWSQIVTISAGFLLLLVAWRLWESARDRSSNTGMAMRLLGAVVLMVGAWVLIAELPRVVSAGDEDWWNGLMATVFYVLGTVPIQLGLALILAALLFQKIRGQTFFRVLYFLPYVAPFVGTAAVFRIIFSNRPTAPLNSMLDWFGAEPLLWLSEPAGIIQMITGGKFDLGPILSGPSLALVAIMLYGIWTYVGFDTVIFLAGLGAIPSELYEVADIDGAGGWAQFRHVTLPLLSPTIYFLSLYAVIGTFKAFNHIFVLRQAAALGTTDTASIVIFQAFKRDTRYGYASALAILLLIIIMVITLINNRIASRRVFYG
ncbi:MAG: sugar ABC transporter permease [Caldilineaceae bacterium]|nr:sugar ABC transporter permease [Caldilineaceae bacterium]